MKELLFLGSLFVLFSMALTSNAEASNPNLYVSAENPIFDNHFAGSMVVEVVINDPNIRSTDQGKGEPDVTLNGKKLRMVQGSNGQWYAYFANVDAAKKADQIVFNRGIGAEGKSLDFGVFCSESTAAGILGDGSSTGNQLKFSQTRGVAIPKQGGIVGSTNGTASFNPCTGSPTSSPILNNVVRQPNSINTNSNIPKGQIGLNQNAWPLIQLFSFDAVEIKYNRAGGTQIVKLQYDEIPNISLTLDRVSYPSSAEVFVTLNDMQLNQDPTDEDSWTFNVSNEIATFYQAFNENGISSGNGGLGLINLNPNLSSLDFEKNGKLSMNIGQVVELTTNDKQPTKSVTDGIKNFNNIVTFVETQPNSGIFENFDESDKSTIKILKNALRGKSDTISYNSKTSSIVTGTATGSVKLNLENTQFQPGTKTKITVTDPDQNVNPGARDKLEVFRSSAIIPTLKIGNPLTLVNANNLKFYTTSLDALSGGTIVPSSIPDKNSNIMIIDTTGTGPTPFEKISMNLGITAGTIQSLLIDNSMQNDIGTNWLNFDLRSFEKQLDITSFSDTSMTLHFGGLPGATSVKILDSGSISSGKGFVKIDDADVSDINMVSSSSSVFLEINFDSSHDTASTGSISSETDKQPVVFDLFSIGVKDEIDINNGIYRLELKETSSNSNTFTGTIEYSVLSQLTLFDPIKIKNTLRTIDEQIHFVVTGRLIDEKGITISYSDVDIGVIITKSSKTDIKTTSGIVSTNSKTFRFGQPVTIFVNDPDLNTNHDKIDVYTTINDPNSPNVDTVGTSSGGILLEVLIKDFRYKRCTINGIEHGGLSSTGFTLTETGPSTGIFEGTFKMPTQICDKTGTKLISSAGGSLDARYHDFRDSSGQSNIFSLSTFSSKIPVGLPPTLNSEKFILPKYGQTTDVILTGKLDNYKSGTSIQFTLIAPDKSSKELNVFATSSGEYKVILTLYDSSKPGLYNIYGNYLNSPIGNVSFQVIQNLVPEWIKNNAQWWSDDQISDSEFIKGIEHLIKEDIILIPDSLKSEITIQEIPSWIKNTARWWSDGTVTDDEFVAALEFLVKNGIIRI